MKITNKTIMVTIESDVTIGNNNAIEATLIHQAFISRDKLGGIDVDLDFADITNVKFLGMDIKDGWDGFKDFKVKMLELGIDVNKLIDEKERELFGGMGFEDNLKFLYKDQI